MSQLGPQQILDTCISNIILSSHLMLSCTCAEKEVIFMATEKFLAPCTKLSIEWMVKHFSYFCKHLYIAYLNNLFGEAVHVSDLLMPTAKRPRGQGEVYKCSWTNSAPWPRAPGITNLDPPANCLLYVEDPGMFCILCTKYNKEPQSDKWICCA